MQFTYGGAIIKGWEGVRAVLKGLVLAACLLFIGSRVLGQQEELLLLVAHIQGLTAFQVTALVGVILLVPLNWGLEALKWQVLAHPVQSITPRQAITSVGTGLALGFVTPRALGDYLGRMVVFDDANKLKILLPVMVSRSAQLLPTVTFGLIGIGAYLGNLPIGNFASAVLPVLVLIAAVTWVAMRKDVRVSKWLSPLKKISVKSWTKVLGYAYLRYVVFATQFIVVLWVMGVDANFYILASGVFWIFLAKSILPSFNFLSDLGVREFSALLFFESYGLPVIPVLSASLFVWVINILLPSVVGLFMGSRQRL